MLKFIELHTKKDSLPVSVNVENVVAFENGDMALREIGIIKVTESYDEVKALIKDAGVLIHKADPRLNLTTPLTMDDLREMIGEPVWNSNNGKWYLMLKVRDDLDPELAVVQDSDAKIEVFSPEELIKFPLYRMNQEVK